MYQDFVSGAKNAFLFCETEKAIENYVTQGRLEDAERTTISTFRDKLKQALESLERFLKGKTQSGITTVVHLDQCGFSDEEVYLLDWVGTYFVSSYFTSGRKSATQIPSAGGEILFDLDAVVEESLALVPARELLSKFVAIRMEIPKPALVPVS